MSTQSFTFNQTQSHKITFQLIKEYTSRHNAGGKQFSGNHGYHVLWLDVPKTKTSYCCTFDFLKSEEYKGYKLFNKRCHKTFSKW